MPKQIVGLLRRIGDQNNAHPIVPYIFSNIIYTKVFFRKRECVTKEMKGIFHSNVAVVNFK